MTLTDFNLIASSPKGYENEACSEVWFLLGEIGDKEASVERSNVSGLIIAKTVLDPFKVIRELRKMLKEKPWEFHYTLRVIPIEVVVPTRLEEIKKACTKHTSKITVNETFRVTVKKRHTKLSTKEIVEVAAESIDRKVDLENPDRIILVEALGGLTGVSVIKAEDVFSVSKERSA